MSSEISGVEIQSGQSGREFRPGRLMIGPLTGVVLSLAAAVVTLAILQAFYPVFAIPTELSYLPSGAPPELVRAHKEAMLRAERNNTALFLAAFGAVLGGLLVIAESVKRRSCKMALIATPASVLLGGGFACAGAWIGHSIFEQYLAIDAVGDVVCSMKIQFAMLATMGSGLGLALGLTGGRLGTVASCMIGGVLAGSLAAVLYPFLAAVLLPMAGTDWPLPAGIMNRALWLGLSASLMGLVIPGLGSRHSSRKQNPPADAEAVE